jgi:hypothetical protein
LPVGNYDLIRGNAELTGTGDARLYGFFQSQGQIAEIEKATAQILQTAIVNVPTAQSNWAFAFWAGDFWLFVDTGVYQYQPALNTTTMRATTKFGVLGAGVSTCAPTTPIK